MSALTVPPKRAASVCILGSRSRSSTPSLSCTRCKPSRSPASLCSEVCRRTVGPTTGVFSEKNIECFCMHWLRSSAQWTGKHRVWVQCFIPQHKETKSKTNNHFKCWAWTIRRREVQSPWIRFVYFCEPSVSTLVVILVLKHHLLDSQSTMRAEHRSGIYRRWSWEKAGKQIQPVSDNRRNRLNDTDAIRSRHLSKKRGRAHRKHRLLWRAVLSFGSRIASFAISIKE